MTRARQKQENKEYILNKLSPEYVSIYRIELNSGRYEILRLSDNTNAKMIVGNDEKADIMEGIGITDTLQHILISEDGKINHFDKVAGDMLTDSIQSIQIAPDGVVTDIYPEAGNEAGKIDLIHDKDRGEISRYARDNHTLILQEPFQLKQGGSGIAIRNPAYLEDENGKEYFWGFTIVIIRVPDIFSDSVKALYNFGYQYRVSKTVAPWNKTYKEVYSSGGELDHPEAYTFNMGGELWKLEIMPKNGWVNNHYLVVVTCGGALIVLLLTGLTAGNSQAAWLCTQGCLGEFAGRVYNL